MALNLKRSFPYVVTQRDGSGEDAVAGFIEEDDAAEYVATMRDKFPSLTFTIHTVGY